MATKELTPQEEANQKLKDLQYAQQSGSTKKVKANLNEGYEINEFDQDYVHVMIENRSWNESRKDTDVTRTVKQFHPNIYESIKGSLGGTEQTVIHDPRENEKVARLKAQKAAMQADAEAKQQEEQERFAKEQADADAKKQAEIDAQQKKIADAEAKDETKKANK